MKKYFIKNLSNKYPTKDITEDDIKSKLPLSTSKKVKYKASINTLKKARRITNKPIVAIGGINSDNYQKLLLNNANFLAISGYIWKNKKMKPIEAINKFI